MLLKFFFAKSRQQNGYTEQREEVHAVRSGQRIAKSSQSPRRSNKLMKMKRKQTGGAGCPGAAIHATEYTFPIFLSHLPQREPQINCLRMGFPLHIEERGACVGNEIFGILQKHFLRVIYKRKRI